MVGKNFYISDLHLFHDNVLKDGRFHERPFSTMKEMLKTIKDNWNSVVTEDDSVYVLGDLAYKSDKRSLAMFLEDLNGNLTLIKGNHDKVVKDPRIARRFEEICDIKQIKDQVDEKEVCVILSHYPILFWNGQHRGTYHLYGHVHDSIEQDLFQRALTEARSVFIIRDKEKYKPFDAFNVGCMMDYMNYTPRTLEQLIKYKKDSEL